MGTVIDFSAWRQDREAAEDFPLCLKEKYPNERKARQAADRMNKRRGSKSTKVGPYECDICEGPVFHLRTARPIEGKLKRRAAARWERDAAA